VVQDPEVMYDEVKKNNLTDTLMSNTLSWLPFNRAHG